MTYANLPPMKNLSSSLAALAVTAWVGSLWAIGYLAVPVLFHAQVDKQLAGHLAGEMLSAGAYLGLLCGVYLLAYRVWQTGHNARRDVLVWLIALMLLMTLLLQFGLQPMMAELKQQALPLEVMNSLYANRFKALHGVSSISYLLESLLGGWLILKWNRTSLRKR